MEEKQKPREVKGLIAPGLRVLLAGPYRGALKVLVALRVKPDHLTAASLAVNGYIAVLIGRGSRALPAGLLLLTGVMDVFDGAIARQRGMASPRGAWFDSVVDRLSDALVLGALFLSLWWQHDRLAAALALAALGVSMLVSQVRAEVESRGASMSEGVFARAERFIVLVIGLWLPHALTPALVLLVGLGAFTIAQRIWLARSALGVRG